MKFSDIKSLSADLLKEEILRAKKEQLNLRFQRASGQLEKPSRIRELRRDVARLKTAQSAQKNAK